MLVPGIGIVAPALLILAALAIFVFLKAPRKERTATVKAVVVLALSIGAFFVVSPVVFEEGHALAAAIYGCDSWVTINGAPRRFVDPMGREFMSTSYTAVDCPEGQFENPNFVFWLSYTSFFLTVLPFAFVAGGLIFRPPLLQNTLYLILLCTTGLMALNSILGFASVGWVPFFQVAKVG